MGLKDRMKKALKAFFEDDAEEKRPVPKGFRLTQNVVDRYCRLRQDIEEGEIAEYDDRYEQFKRLENNIRSAGQNVNKLYEEFLAGREFLPEEEREALDIAEEIFQEPTEKRKSTKFMTPTKGEDFVEERESDHIYADGSATSVSEETIAIAACGKKLSSKDEIVGFCSVCDKAICSDHEEYCVGYGTSRCGKLLCPDHVYIFQTNSESHPCCDHHYKTRMYLDDMQAIQTPPDHPNKEDEPEDE